MIRRLKLKFVAVTMSIVTVLLVAIFSLVLVLTRENLEKQSTQMIETVTAWRFSHGGNQEGTSPMHDPGVEPDVSLNDRKITIHLPFILLDLDKNGDLEEIVGKHYIIYDKEIMEVVLEETLRSGAKEGHIWEYNLRYQRITDPFGEQVVIVDISSEVATMDHLVRTCNHICILSFFVFFGLSILLANWMVKPVEESWVQQRQFVADASHELKTPLTVILTSVELLHRTEGDEAQKARLFANIDSMSRQMQGLVSSLLDLARADDGLLKQWFTKVSISDAVNESMLPFEPVYFEKGLKLEAVLEEGLYVTGSMAHLKQVTEILLDNACKYTQPDSTVTVTLKARGAQCLLSVSNPGDPISQEEAKHLFERFYRRDKARSTDGSYGLGLAIARKIIQEHGGKIWVESRDGINSFRVQLNLRGSSA